MIKTTNLLRPGAEARITFDAGGRQLAAEPYIVTATDAWGVWVESDHGVETNRRRMIPWGRIVYVDTEDPTAPNSHEFTVDLDEVIR